jgi:hypothetical protein
MLEREGVAVVGEVHLICTPTRSSHKQVAGWPRGPPARVAAGPSAADTGLLGWPPASTRRVGLRCPQLGA